MQIVVVIICDNSSYIQKSEHYGANKTTGVVFAFKCLCYVGFHVLLYLWFAVNFFCEGH